MKLLVLADTKVSGPFPAADILVSLGDLDRRYLEQVRAGILGGTALAIPGNHDPLDFAPSGWRSLHARTAVLHGSSFAGFGGCLPYKEGPWFFAEDAVSSFLASLPSTEIMLSHNSPHGVHDDPEHEPHCGYVSFAKQIERNPPKLWLHGHQHKNVTSSVRGVAVVGVFGAALIDWDSRRAQVVWLQES